MKYGFKIQGHFGDVLNTTPIIKYISQKQEVKLLVETNQPYIFKNNPYVEKIYDSNLGEVLPKEIKIFNCNVHHTVEGNQKNIRKHSLIDYWSTNLGFILHPNERTLEYYPDPIDIELPKKKFIVINPSVTDVCRTWDIEKWKKLITLIKHNTDLEIVVVGKDIKYPDGNVKGVYNINDHRVINTIGVNLSSLWHYINNSLATITMDTGVLHLAGTTDTNIIVLGSPINPWYRMPYRKGSQDYKQIFVKGNCDIFCQSDLKYSKPDYSTGNNWRVIDGFPTSGWCYENKSIFECHPTPEKVFNTLLKILNIL